MLTARDHARLSRVEGWAYDSHFLDALVGALDDPAVPSVVGAALRSRSLHLRSLLAHLATSGRLSYAEIAEAPASTSGLLDVVARPWLVALARVVALQTGEAGDQALAARLLEAVPSTELEWRDRLLLAQLLVALARGWDAIDVLESGRVADDERHFVELDVANPFVASETANPSRWQQLFTQFFLRHGLEPPSVGADATPFDVLDCIVADRVTGGPLVTVVMTTFRPGPHLFGSVRSILRQTWQELELIVVDDASGPEYDRILEDVAGLDSRIRLVRLNENRGTYLARNAALALAHGEYVTGQDDDDWSHPRRIERQIAPLLEGRAMTTVSHALRATPDLRIAAPGARPMALHMPSFMAPLTLLRGLGGYLPARKAADRELIDRVARATGTSPLLLTQPLALYRLAAASLSRDEFSPGWTHPARTSFRVRADRAHTLIERLGRPLSDTSDEMRVPRRYAIEPQPLTLDALVVADWSAGPGSPHPLVAEVRALADAGLRVGVCHVEDLRRTHRRALTWSDDIVDLINAGTVEELLLDENAEVPTVLVYDPGILQFPPYVESRVQAGQLVLVDLDDGRAPLRVAAECAANARRLFGCEPVWAAVTDAGLGRLKAEVGVDRVEPEVRRITDTTVPTIRRGRRAGAAIVGCMVDSTTSLAWVDGLAPGAHDALDVRAYAWLGGTEESGALRQAHPDCLVYAAEDVAFDGFLRQLDYVFSPAGASWQAASLTRVATAAGVPCVPSTLLDFG